MRRTAITLFVVVAIAEAFSWLALLIGMVVKYGPSGTETGVQIFGPIHGGLFMAYVGLVLVVSRLARWSWLVTGVALACAVPPFATVLFERWARRRGILVPTPAGPGPEPRLAESVRR